MRGAALPGSVFFLPNQLVFNCLQPISWLYEAGQFCYNQLNEILPETVSRLVM